MDVSNIRNRKGLRIDAAYHAADGSDWLAILGHGVTGNKDRPLLVGLAEGLAALGVPCLRVSFAGNGDSEGRFEDVTVTSEAEDLVDLLDLRSSGRKIVYIGHSMGGAVGTLVAAKEQSRIQFLVSLAGMVEVADFFQREFGEEEPGRGLMWDEPDCPLSQVAMDDAAAVGSTLAAAAEVTQPWLLIHGTADDVVPVEDSRAAVEAAATRTRLVELPGEGHMFSEGVYGRIAREIVDWIEAR